MRRLVDPHSTHVQLSALPECVAGLRRVPSRAEGNRPAHAGVAAAMLLAALIASVTAIAADPPAGQQPQPAGAPPARAGAASGQPPGPPPPPKNLQFFPKDTPRPELIQTMRQFSFALGVRCEHCHVDEHDSPTGQEDFAADTKQPKLTARAMLQMTKKLNEELLTAIPGRLTPPVRVQCVTCHHGLPRPETLAARMQACAAAGGIDSAVAEVRHLRDDSFSGQFDLREWGINEVARSFSVEGKPDEALALLRVNAEFNPESTAIPPLMAEAYVAKGDRAAAIDILHKVLAKDPQNRRAQRLLDQLEGGGPGGKP